MKTTLLWLDEYGESHQNKTNKSVHWVCVPVIIYSLIGLLRVRTKNQTEPNQKK